ncbi:MAG: ATP-dependent helicase [Candidatus Thermoplasmatota archaeon]
MSGPLRSLTREQRAVVTCGAHAVAVHAGAGTGKTLTLAHRVARLGADARSQSRLLVVTFTREATASLQRRISILLGRDHGVRVLSFHQWAARELPPEERRFLGEGEAHRIIESLLKREPMLSRALGREDAVSRAQSFLGFVRNRELSVSEAVRGPFAPLAALEDALVALQASYEEKKGGRLDYDDVPIAFRDRLRAPSERARVAGALDHLLVDEYQDVNGVQAETVHLLTVGRAAPDVMVVGDARQSIYGFRGGSPTHLTRFHEPYGGRARVLGLTTNFRAVRRLVDAANLVESGSFPMRAAQRARLGVAPHLASFADGAAEARSAADGVESLLRAGEDPSGIAVLARARFLAQPYCEEVAARLREDQWLLENAPACTAWLDGTDAIPAVVGRVLARRERQGVPMRRLVSRIAALRPTVGLDRVLVRTIHAAKGLEWDHVLLLGAREGGLPSEQALRAPGTVQGDLLAEERRLLYVAMTRARKSFTVSWAGRRSRFLLALAGGEPTSGEAMGETLGKPYSGSPRLLPNARIRI